MKKYLIISILAFIFALSVPVSSEASYGDRFAFSNNRGCGNSFSFGGNNHFYDNHFFGNYSNNNYTFGGYYNLYNRNYNNGYAFGRGYNNYRGYQYYW